MTSSQSKSSSPLSFTNLTLHDTNSIDNVSINNHNSLLWKSTLSIWTHIGLTSVKNFGPVTYVSGSTLTCPVYLPEDHGSGPRVVVSLQLLFPVRSFDVSTNYSILSFTFALNSEPSVHFFYKVPPLCLVKRDFYNYTVSFPVT